MFDLRWTAIYVLKGRSVMRYGDGLREQLEVGAEQFLFIPAGVPQLPSNPSDDEACVAVLARTDPNEQESVVLLGRAGPKADDGRQCHERRIPPVSGGTR
jgi:uncharacterized RmlC-like cupin family protein